MPTLSPTHLAAIARRRRLIVNFDVTFAINVQHRRNPDRPDLMEHLFEFANAPRSQIDSIWWNWGEGNQAPYPSKHLPLYDHPLYQLGQPSLCLPRARRGRNARRQVAKRTIGNDLGNG